MNLPNKLTIARVALIPLMVAAMYLPGRAWELTAAALFAVASFTDYLDGHIARSRGLVTDFGKFLDPVADKILVLSAFTMLLHKGMLPAWVLIVVLARELSVDGLRMVAVGQGKVIAAGMLGKIKTVSQMGLVLWLLVLGRHVGQSWLDWVLCGWVVFITLLSGADYFRRNIDVIRLKKREEA